MPVPPDSRGICPSPLSLPWCVQQRFLRGMSRSPSPEELTTVCPVPRVSRYAPPRGSPRHSRFHRKLRGMPPSPGFSAACPFPSSPEQRGLPGPCVLLGSTCPAPTLHRTPHLSARVLYGMPRPTVIFAVCQILGALRYARSNWALHGMPCLSRGLS